VCGVVAGQRERAVSYLQRWVDGHPNDTQASQLLQQERVQMGVQPSTPPPTGLFHP